MANTHSLVHNCQSYRRLPLPVERQSSKLLFPWYRNVLTYREGMEATALVLIKHLAFPKNEPTCFALGFSLCQRASKQATG